MINRHFISKSVIFRLNPSYIGSPCQKLNRASRIGCRVDIFILAASCPNLAPSPVLALDCEFYPRKVLGAYLK